LSSIEWVTSGAAPLGAKTIESMQQTWPKWKVGQGYGKMIQNKTFSRIITETTDSIRLDRE
jgi:hypothetical protein